VSSAYHPQTNGLDERTNQTLKIRLGKLALEHGKDWDEYLEATAYSIRTQKQKSTKYSPFFLMFGRHANSIMTDVEEDQPSSLPEPEITEDDLTAYVKSRSEVMGDIKLKVEENVANAQVKQKMEFENRKGKGVKVFTFSVGDLVLRRNVRLKKISNNLAQFWSGPYR
jgi:hypothetical protein